MLRIWAPLPAIRSFRIDIDRWPLWWTASVTINGQRIRKLFRARTDEGAKAKAYAWIEEEKGAEG